MPLLVYPSSLSCHIVLSLLFSSRTVLYARYISSSSAFSNHPYLHSFPTRRSSDLYSSGPNHQMPSIALADQIKELGFDIVRFKTRSEEHTSELQSRGHLVCRLLLEKKKRYFSILFIVYTHTLIFDFTLIE